jgi:hypothetical protein
MEGYATKKPVGIIKPPVSRKSCRPVGRHVYPGYFPTEVGPCSALSRTVKTPDIFRALAPKNSGEPETSQALR